MVDRLPSWMVSREVVVPDCLPTALAALLVLGLLSWWPKRAIRSCFDRRVAPLQQVVRKKFDRNETHGETREISSLLEALREIPCLWETIEPAEDRKKIQWRVILNQLHEFPDLLRDRIQSCADSVRDLPTEQQQLDTMEERIQELVTEFLFGFMGKGNQDPLRDYHGLDSNSVTEKEVEVVLRCFPELLTVEFDAPPTRNLHGAYPIYALTYSELAVSFVPIFAKIGAEVGSFKDDERGGLICGARKSCGAHNVLNQLLSNTNLRVDFGQHPSRALDENSLRVLMRLRDMGMVTKKDESDMIVRHLLYEESQRVGSRDGPTQRDFDFIASRLRLVVNDWNPNLLRNCGQLACCGLLDIFLTTYRNSRRSHRMFGLILELGMLHYPLELGFVFHDHTFGYACEQSGKETVCSIIDDKLSKMLAQENNALAAGDLVFAALRNTDIALDAVYVLIRREPNLVLPNSRMH